MRIPLFAVSPPAGIAAHFLEYAPNAEQASPALPEKKIVSIPESLRSIGKTARSGAHVCKNAARRKGEAFGAILNASLSTSTSQANFSFLPKRATSAFMLSATLPSPDPSNPFRRNARFHQEILNAPRRIPTGSTPRTDPAATTAKGAVPVDGRIDEDAELRDKTPRAPAGPRSFFLASSSMPLRDILMILSSFTAMAAGAFLPQLAKPLAFLPRICLMLLLYLGFLSVGTEALFAQARVMPARILEFIGLRLLALPLFAFAVFQVLMPSFALGALLVSASCVGVVAPVFSNMMRADTPFILVTCLATSLLLPASLPALLYATDTAAQALHLGRVPLPADLTLSDMTLSLCVTIIVPFVAAFVTRNQTPKAAVLILRNQFPVALTANSLSTLSVFSQYAEVLHQDPSLVLHALGAALLLGLLMMIAGTLLPRAMPRKQRLAFLIGFGTMNNVLILILSMQFFSVNEALIAALYLIPLNALLVVYRLCSRRWGLDA